MIVYESKGQGNHLELDGFNELVTAQHAVDYVVDHEASSPELSLSRVATLSALQEKVHGMVRNANEDSRTSLAELRDRKQEFEGEDAQVVLSALSRYALKHKEIGSFHAENAAYMVDNLGARFDTSEIPRMDLSTAKHVKR